MDQISDVSFEKLTESRYLKPIRMKFKQHGRARIWDLMISHDSVTCVLYHTQRRALIFVKQFRPAVFANCGSTLDPSLSPDPDAWNKIDWSKISPETGITLELCAGIVDKTDKNELETVQEEIHEECGYDVPLSQIERITSFRSGIGLSGSKQTLFYAEVDDSMKISNGGGLDDEMIDVVYVPLEQGKQLIYNETLPRPAGFIFGVMWFYDQKAHKYTSS